MEKEMSYRQKADAAIRDLLLEYECQPILFVGSGISRRYFGAPNWHELLKEIFAEIGSKDAYEYNRQKYSDDPMKIGSVLSDLVFEWAWNEGRSLFPAEFFSSNISKDLFLKYLTCLYFKRILTNMGKNENATLKKEIDALSQIKPHAIITTNYDGFLEEVFEGYEPIVGQTILRYNTNSFGEIFHIHGAITEPSSIILTQEDYEDWNETKKYVTAKLLTYFAEHPVFIFGYGIGDPNVKSILRDIGEIVSDEGGLIPNVYQVVWRSGEIENHPPDQAVIAMDGREYRIHAIHTRELEWVFKALKSQSALTSINPKLVRALAARTMKLIRHDIPSGKVAVNYDVLERVADEVEFLPTLLGITTVDNPNQSHPYTLSQIAKRIGFATWHPVNKIINKIKDETGIDLRSTDNRYHCKIKTGNAAGSATRKWSHEAVSLFQKIDNGEKYALQIDSEVNK